MFNEIQAQSKESVTLSRFAFDVTNGMWSTPPHIAVLNEKLMDLMWGDTDRLMVMCPPRHGKSEACSHFFPPFYLGSKPTNRIILTAYDQEFATKWGRMGKEVFANHGMRFFGAQVNPEKDANSEWEVYGGNGGGMTCVGAGAGMTGRGADLLIIDDPIKNPEEAFSEAMRQRLWDWYISVCTYRMEPGGKILMLYTPWHEDDIGQRILRMAADGEMEKWEVLRMPAIAETQDERDEYAEEFGLPLGQPDPIGREPGEALWPERYSLKKLRLKQLPNPEHFEALFQGRPKRRTGGFFQSIWWRDKEKGIDRYVNQVPTDQGTIERVRYWDRAGSHLKGDYTAGVLMARVGTKYYIEHVIAGQWAAGVRDRIIREVAQSDKLRGTVAIRGEQEPGSSGMDAAHAFVTMLAGYDVQCKVVTGDKEARARTLASQAQIGNVFIVKGDWNKATVAQLTSFPKGKNDDIVDAASGAFNTLANQAQTFIRKRSPTSGYIGRVQRYLKGV